MTLTSGSVAGATTSSKGSVKDESWLGFITFVSKRGTATGVVAAPLLGSSVSTTVMLSDCLFKTFMVAWFFVLAGCYRSRQVFVSSIVTDDFQIPGGKRKEEEEKK